MPVRMPCCRRVMPDVPSSVCAKVVVAQTSNTAPISRPAHHRLCHVEFKKKIPKASTDPEDYTRNSSSPIPQPTRERRSSEPTRGSPFCYGERSQTICRVLGVKRSDSISFASQRRDPLAGSPSRQVFWLMVRPIPRAFPSMNRTVAFMGFVPIYSGGTARDLHPLPLPRSHIVEGTLGDREEGCQVHSCPPSPPLLILPTGIDPTHL